MEKNEKEKDLEFLIEMKERLNRAPFDGTEYSMVDEMIADWIRELQEKVSQHPPTKINN